MRFSSIPCWVGRALRGAVTMGAGAVLLTLAACAGMPERMSRPTMATPGKPTMGCDALSAAFSHPGTRLTSVEQIAAGQLKLPGIAEPMPEHCLVKGRMHERTGPIDGKPYAIGFEMRLPTAWNGRFFYQGNGGLDGIVAPAYGDVLGGAPRSNGVLKGFAVLSSDAGHALLRDQPNGGAVFGIDPQARLDYGHNAVAQLTPMAHALIRTYYGRRADKSYLVGTSNGGRHGFVAAARDTGLNDGVPYDGVLSGTPGYNLPRAALAEVWGAQQFAAISRQDEKTQRPDLQTSFPPADLALVAAKITERCDALDGLRDGIVADVMGCQTTFNLAADVPECGGAPDGTCLSAAQKKVLATVFAGPKDASGAPVYTGLPWDPGIRGNDWRTWKFVHSVGPRGAVALAFVFSTPPASPDVVTGHGTTLVDYALAFDVARDGRRIFAKEGPYTQSAMEFMTPPEPDSMQSFVRRGGKLLVFHGAADPVFSLLDTISWYEAFSRRHGPAARDSAQLFVVPGMNHSRGGPATDQFDMLDALVAWVERGAAPEAVVATARGPGANVVNPELPAAWSPGRTRLLCAYPAVARYRGTGDPESADSFACVRS